MIYHSLLCSHFSLVVLGWNIRLSQVGDAWTTTASPRGRCLKLSEHGLRVGLYPWWCHEMETFSTLLALCAGNSPVTSEFPAHRQVTRSCDVFFDPRPNKRLSKQSRRWWFETASCPLWRDCNAYYILYCQVHCIGETVEIMYATCVIDMLFKMSIHVSEAWVTKAEGLL